MTTPIKMKELISFLDKRFPIHLQEEYDNAGEQISFRETAIRGILISLDLDGGVIDEALERGCNAIITHHPFFFEPLNRIIAGEPRSDMLRRLLENGVSLYSAHTNLDKVYYDKLSEALGIGDTELLLKTDLPREGDAGDFGFGVYGQLAESMRLREFMAEIREKLKLDFLFFSGDENRDIRRVAIINGAGGGLLGRVLIERELDCIVTGDVGHHHYRNALAHGVAVVDAGHFGTERILLFFLRDEITIFLKEGGYSDQIRVSVSKREENPLRVYP
jgi:dinuclear metal center YbgI/SA1388 family protein